MLKPDNLGSDRVWSLTCIRPYSLNTTTTFYFVTECSDVTVVVLRACACQNTSVLYLALTRVGLSVLLWM